MKSIIMLVSIFIAFGIGIFISPEITMFQEIAVKNLYKKKGVTSVIYNEKLKLVLDIRERDKPNLSVTARLTDESGNDKTNLGSTDKGIIECTVENKGAPAQNVRVNWKEHFTLEVHQLKITRPTKSISEISQGGSEVFKISVETVGRKNAGRITITLEPIYIQKGQTVRSASEPHTFELFLTP